MALGENIKAWRERKGWSTHRLALEAGTNQPNISRYETNKNRPGLARLRRIAAALGTDPMQLEYGIPNVELIPIGTRRIPILNSTQVAKWTGVASDLRNSAMQEFILTPSEHSAKAFAMVVHGDSMLPEFREGDIITVDPEVLPGPGDYVVACAPNGDVNFRRYKSVGPDARGVELFELRPLNDFYPTLSSDVAAIKLIGTVVSFERRLREDKS